MQRANCLSYIFYFGKLSGKRLGYSLVLMALNVYDNLRAGLTG